MTPEVAGMEVGDEVGTSAVALVGSAVGKPVGAEVGTSAVALVGSAVGKAVGAEVGTCESLVPLDEPARRQMQKIVQYRCRIG